MSRITVDYPSGASLEEMEQVSGGDETVLEYIYALRPLS